MASPYNQPLINMIKTESEKAKKSSGATTGGSRNTKVNKKSASMIGNH